MSVSLPTVDSPAVTPTQRRYTYEELMAEFPETNQPCELWDGEVVMSPTPSFYHQEITLRLYRLLFDWVEERNLGKVITAPIDMVLSAHRVVQPDVAFIARERLGIIQRVIMGPADLAAEVISLGGRERDRIHKRDLYEQYGIKEYWILDPESATVDVLFLESGRYTLAARGGRSERIASRLLPGFVVSLDAVFAERPGQL